MTKIDFYILSEQASQSRELLACRLAEKAYHKQHHIYIHTASQEQASMLDNLLWTFNQGSFLPHDLLPGNGSPAAPISIGYQDAPDIDYDVMINLSEAIPPFFSRFTRVAEVVDQAPASRSQARERYRFYRDRGYSLDTHELKN
jgi:DNA polymerase-3 subunit chi